MEALVYSARRQVTTGFRGLSLWISRLTVKVFTQDQGDQPSCEGSGDGWLKLPTNQIFIAAGDYFLDKPLKTSVKYILTVLH